MEYITDADLEIAAQNGIHESLAKDRWRKGWSKRRAITQKPRVSLWAKYKEQCEAIGLTQGGFYSRINKGKMTPEDAATMPLTPPGGRNPKLSPTDLEIAAKNGINKNTAGYRVYALHWTTERAITEPVDPKYHKKAFGYDKGRKEA